MPWQNRSAHDCKYCSIISNVWKVFRMTLRPVQRQCLKWKKYKYCFYYKYCLEFVIAKNENNASKKSLFQKNKIWWSKNVIILPSFVQTLAFLQKFFNESLFKSTICSWNLPKKNISTALLSTLWKKKLNDSIIRPVQKQCW